MKPWDTLLKNKVHKKVYQQFFADVEFGYWKQIAHMLFCQQIFCKHQQHNKKGGILSVEPIIMTQNFIQFPSGLVCICFMHNSGCIAGPFFLNNVSFTSSSATLGVNNISTVFIEIFIATIWCFLVARGQFLLVLRVLQFQLYARW